MCHQATVGIKVQCSVPVITQTSPFSVRIICRVGQLGHLTGRPELFICFLNSILGIIRKPLLTIKMQFMLSVFLSIVIHQYSELLSPAATWFGALNLLRIPHGTPVASPIDSRVEGILG